MKPETIEEEQQNWALKEEIWIQLRSDLSLKVAQSRPALCNPIDYTVHGILQIRDWAQVSHIAGRFFTS